MDPERGSVLLQVEHFLAERIGHDMAGRMHTGRSRNDHQEAANRVLVRDRLLDLADATLRLQDTVLDLALEHADALMPGYTHLQHAQPTTLGHYIMRHYYPFERDQQRLQGAFKRTNLSALGGAACVGTTWPVDRHRTAELLGHGGLVVHATDAGVFARDYPAENAAVLSILANDVGRLAGDLYVWSTWEFGMIEVEDGMANTSSIMPQKKNPEALERVRGLSGIAVGWLPAVLHEAVVPVMHAQRRAVSGQWALCEPWSLCESAGVVYGMEWDGLTMRREKEREACDGVRQRFVSDGIRH